jgi:trehalose-6-phosphatase
MKKSSEMTSKGGPSKKKATISEVTLDTSRASEAEIAAASSLVELRKKKVKKAIQKVTVKVMPRVPCALSDDEEDECHPSGDSHHFCCSMKLGSYSIYIPTSKSEFVDIEKNFDKILVKF